VATKNLRARAWWRETRIVRASGETTAARNRPKQARGAYGGTSRQSQWKRVFSLQKASFRGLSGPGTTVAIPGY